MDSANYNEQFFRHNRDTSYVSAYHVLRALFAVHTPQSILDVGCGIGTWGKAAKDFGVKAYLGVDGDYVNREQLVVDPKEFVPADLTQSLRLNSKFDLAISMEVAEHIPESAADVFIESLCNHTDFVLFSAAIPYQGGVHHVNEQWQSYWLDRFRKQGFQAFDLVRPRVWNNAHVAEYYKQNVLAYIRSTAEGLIERVAREAVSMPLMVNVVHPDSYLIKANPANWPLLDIVKILPFVLGRVFKNRVLRKP